MRYFYKYLSLCIIVLFGVTGYAQVLINENFDATTSFPQGWVSPTLPAFTITSSNSCDGNSVRGPLNSNSISPELAYMSQATTGEDIIISFDYKILQNAIGNPATIGNFGRFDLQYSVDGGHSWKTYYTINETSHTPSVSCATLTHTIDRSDVPFGSDFGWRIKGQYNQGDNFIYIDNFTAIEQVDCLQPTNVVVENVTFDSIEISWSEINATPATSWQVAYCPEGIGPTNPVCFLNNLDNTTSNPHTITGLLEATNYDIYIKSICSTTEQSVWTGPIKVQTLAFGTNCESPLTISLPYNHNSNTKVYDNNYSGTPGSSCNTGSNFLDGNDVVYHYNSTQENILQIELTGNLSEMVGVFVYEDCADIGVNCFAGNITEDGSPFGISDLYIEKDKDYYIVISTFGVNTSTEYTLNITGFECSTWEAPAGDSNYEFANQTLEDYFLTKAGVYPTIEGAQLTWYSDASLTIKITDLSNVVLKDNDEFWVTQTVLGCESPPLHITFNEFDCSTLSISDIVADSKICDVGTTRLTASASSNNIIWYDQETGGNIVANGTSFEIPEITETTSFWASEFFMGEAFLSEQANPGPTKIRRAYDNAGVEFELTRPTIIKDVQVYITGSTGDLIVELEDSESIQTRKVNVPGGSIESPTLVTIPLNFEIADPTNGPFKLTKTAGPDMLMTESEYSSFPYKLGNIGKVINGISKSSKSSNYYYFYNWTIISVVALCESERREVKAIVNETKSINIDVSESAVCLGGFVDLSVTSEDENYDYTWEWYDNNGVKQTSNNKAIRQKIDQRTRFSVTAVNQNTGCSIQEEIQVDAVGVEEIPLFPTTVDICVGEVIKLNAGQIAHTFENTITDWTFNNNSSPASGVSSDVADWKLVSSPYTLADMATSNDNSSFMITMADPLGPRSQVDTEMISPPINLVGAQDAKLEFYHYYKHHTTKETIGRLEISDDGGKTWSTLESYSTNQGSATNFKKVSIDLEPYLGLANVLIKFKYMGEWGWWWAVDNVIVTQDYLNGQVVWDGLDIQNLYLDENASIAYQGQPTSVVYFKGENEGVFEYEADLIVSECSELINNTVTVTVNKVDTPKGKSHQEFIAKSKVADLDVLGVNLMYYLLIDDKYIRQSINSELINNATYYVSQRINGCTSDFLKINVDLICPNPIDLNVSIDLSQDGNFAAAVVYWEHPLNPQGIEGYQLVVKNKEGKLVEESYLSNKQSYKVIDSLPLNQTFIIELNSVCDAIQEVYGETLQIDFSTANLSVKDLQPLDFTYYPNPVADKLYVDSSQLIDDIAIYSYDGKLLYSKKHLLTKSTTIDVSELSSGVYLLIANSDSKSKMVRLIKK